MSVVNWAQKQMKNLSNTYGGNNSEAEQQKPKGNYFVEQYIADLCTI